MPKKVVVAYAYGTTNAGDHALTLGALELLQSVDTSLEISVVSRYSTQEEPSRATQDIQNKFPGVRAIPSPFAFSRENAFLRLLQKAHGFLLVAFSLLLPGLADRVFHNNIAIQEIADADLVLCNGGNLFYWNEHRKSLPRLIALAFPMYLARRLDIPYGLLPQTMGPFEGKMSELVFRRVFEDAEFIQFREPISPDHAETIADLSKTRTSVVPDLAFVSEPKPSNGSRLEHLGGDSINLEGEFVAVTLRASQLGDPEVSTNTDVDENEIVSTAEYMSGVISSLVKKCNLNVCIVVQTVNDMAVSYEIADILRDNVKSEVFILEGRNPQELSMVYERAEVLVGMRLHSIIFALRVGTPAMGVYKQRFGPKIEGTLQMFGLSRYSVQESNIPPQVASESLNNLFTERSKLRRNINSKNKHLSSKMQKDIKNVLDRGE